MGLRSLRNGKWKLGARFYDSSKSAFMQQDRYLGDPSDPLSLNRYSYCGLDPVNFVDPTGFNAQAVIEFGEALQSSPNPYAIIAGRIIMVIGALIVGGEIYDANQSVSKKAESTSLPIKGTPNSDVYKQGKNGVPIQKRHYDENGNADYDIDYTDHGTPNAHTNPHKHEWKNGKRGGPEPVED